MSKRASADLYEHITDLLTLTTPPLDPPGFRTREDPAKPWFSARAIDRLAVPRPRALLAAILVARLICVGLVVGGLSAVGDAPEVRIGAVTAVLAALGGAAWLGLRLRRRGEALSPTALFVQATIDVLLVTALVAVTTFRPNVSVPGAIGVEGVGRGGPTQVAALYVALVTAYALLLPVGRGLLAVAMATSCYIAVTLLLASDAAGTPGPEYWTQVGVIAFIGSLIAVLGNRLGSAAMEQRALEAALKQVRLEADEILATIQSGVITVDGEGRLGYINPRGLRILGASVSTFVQGEPILETLRSKSRELHDAIARGIRDRTRIARGEAAVRRDDGSLFPVGLSTTTFQRPGSEHPSVTAIFTDISELKRLQELRLRAERLEAVAALSASLAHEIRNPLAAIRSAVEQLARSVGDDEDDQTLARLVMRESERLNRLLNEFLDFARVRAANFTSLALLDLVRDAARVVGELPAAHGVTIVVEGEPMEIEADEDLLHRIATNLILNAAQALDGPGTITVSVGESLRGEGSSGGVERRVKLVIRDDGPGIPESIRERLFEPFVTGRQGGSGLGLAIVQRAVSAHRGIILLDSTPNTGTTFSIFLPATWNREDAA